MGEKAKKTTPKKNFSKQYSLLSDMMDNIPDVVYFKDLKGKLLYVNTAYAKGLDLTPQQIIGKTDFDIFPKNRAQRMLKDDMYVLQKGKPLIDKIERSTRPDGRDNFVSTTKIPRYNKKGEVVGLIGITRDITKRMRFERKRERRIYNDHKLEMLEDLKRLRENFFSAVSHELRTPLAIIKQLVNIVFDEVAGPVNNQQREVFVKLRTNIDRLKNIIEKMLDMARVEGSRLRLQYSLSNIKELVSESREYFTEIASEKNITLKYVFPKKDVNVFIDVERIIQVVSNLINNAIKYTEANGHVKVELKVLASKIRVGVIDTGIGIEKSDLTRVFDQFVQVSNRKDLEMHGVGLGLSIVKEIVEKHGGEIWVESERGVGSKFYFTLPRYYTLDILGKRMNEKVKELFNRNFKVNVVNLLIVNFDLFKKRIDVGAKKLSSDLKEIIEESTKTFPSKSGGKEDRYSSGFRRGKMSIVFSEVPDKNVNKYCNVLKKDIKEYFVQHKIDDVFIALGMLSHDTAKKISRKQELPPNINIKELYVGSEMRRFRRINYAVEGKLFATKKEYVVKTVDVSKTGVCMTSNVRLKTDSKVSVQIPLLRMGAVLRAKAKVCWIRKIERKTSPGSPRYKFGLDFIQIDKKDKTNYYKEIKLYYD